jgi:predicted  nucleic acid-binding Zn-ribbon protein
MVQESEELRRRAGSAEEQVARLKREMEDLQIEITRLGKEIDRLTTERVAMTDVVQRGMSGIVRLVDEVVATLKER